MAKVPAYFTVAFDLAGAVKIQQIQYREVVEVDGQLVDVKLYPVDLIKTPLDNDLITGALKDATDAISAGALKAVTDAQAERDAAEEKFAAVEGERIEALKMEMVAKDANIQAMMAELAELKGAQ